ncbi:MAG: hypothetical protein IEMM0006_0643 [bacterium]|nr:MAG: hypothetical protein IEMM0006_0643 [bacterium]
MVFSRQVKIYQESQGQGLVKTTSPCYIRIDTPETEIPELVLWEEKIVLTGSKFPWLPVAIK